MTPRDQFEVQISELESVAQDYLTHNARLFSDSSQQEELDRRLSLAVKTAFEQLVIMSVPGDVAVHGEDQISDVARLIRVLKQQEGLGLEQWKIILPIIGKNQSSLDMRAVLFDECQNGNSLGSFIIELYHQHKSTIDLDEHDKLLDDYLCLVQNFQFQSAGNKQVVAQELDAIPQVVEGDDEAAVTHRPSLWQQLAAIYREVREQRNGIRRSEARYFQICEYHGLELFVPHIEGMAERAGRSTRPRVARKIAAMRTDFLMKRHKVRVGASQISTLLETTSQIELVIDAIGEVRAMVERDGDTQGRTILAVFDSAIRMLASVACHPDKLVELLDGVQLFRIGNVHAAGLFDKARLVFFKKIAVLKDQSGPRQALLRRMMYQSSASDDIFNVLEAAELNLGLVDALMPYCVHSDFQKRVFLKVIVDFREQEFSQAISTHDLDEEFRGYVESLSARWAAISAYADGEEFVLTTVEEFSAELENILSEQGAYQMCLLDEWLTDLLEKSELSDAEKIDLLARDHRLANYLLNMHQTSIRSVTPATTVAGIVDKIAKKFTVEQFKQIFALGDEEAFDFFVQASKRVDLLGQPASSGSRADNLMQMLSLLSQVNENYRRFVLDNICGLAQPCADPELQPDHDHNFTPTLMMSRLYANGAGASGHQFLVLLKEQLALIDAEAEGQEAGFKEQEYEKVMGCLYHYIDRRVANPSVSGAEMLGLIDFIAQLPVAQQLQALSYATEVSHGSHLTLGQCLLMRMMNGQRNLQTSQLPAALASYLKLLTHLVSAEGAGVEAVSQILAQQDEGEQTLQAKISSAVMLCKEVSVPFDHEYMRLQAALGQDRMVEVHDAGVAAIVIKHNAQKYFDRFKQVDFYSVANNLLAELNKMSPKAEKVRGLLLQFILRPETTSGDRQDNFALAGVRLATKLAGKITSISKMVTLFYEAIATVVTSSQAGAHVTQHEDMLVTLVDRHLSKDNKNLQPLMACLSVLHVQQRLSDEVVNRISTRLQEPKLVRAMAKFPVEANLLVETLLEKLPASADSQRQILEACQGQLPGSLADGEAASAAASPVMNGSAHVGGAATASASSGGGAGIALGKMPMTMAGVGAQEAAAAAADRAAVLQAAAEVADDFGWSGK